MDNKRILVADDEPSIRSLVSSILEKDYTVYQASDGQEAVNSAYSQKPDLILMDIMMPKMDGYTACHVIKTEPTTKMIPVVMLTGVGHELNKKLAQEIGADEYMTNPFSPQELIDTIVPLLPSRLKSFD